MPTSNKRKNQSLLVPGAGRNQTLKKKSPIHTSLNWGPFLRKDFEKFRPKACFFILGGPFFFVVVPGIGKGPRERYKKAQVNGWRLFLDLVYCVVWFPLLLSAVWSYKTNFFSGFFFCVVFVPLSDLRQMGYFVWCWECGVVGLFWYFRLNDLFLDLIFPRVGFLFFLVFRPLGANKNGIRPCFFFLFPLARILLSPKPCLKQKTSPKIEALFKICPFGFNFREKRYLGLFNKILLGPIFFCFLPFKMAGF